MQVEVTRVPELELPIEVSVAYIMFEDFQQGAQYSRRLTGESVIKTDIALPVVMSAPRAVMVARSSLYSAIAGRNVYKFSTTLEWAKLEPGDVVILNSGDFNTRVRIISREESNGVVQFEAVGDLKHAFERNPNPDDYGVKPPGPGDESSALEGSYDPLPTPQPIVHDVPKFSSDDEGPRVMVDFIQVLPKMFAGLQLVLCDIIGGNYIPRDMEPILVRSLPTVGRMKNKLNTATTTSKQLDTSSIADVKFQTTAGLDTHDNPIHVPQGAPAGEYDGGILAKVGDEYIAFDAVTPMAGDVMRISRMRRRILVGSNLPIVHSDKETFSIVKTMIKVPIKSEDIGKKLSIRAISIGGTIEDAKYTDFIANDAGMKGVITINDILPRVLPPGGTLGQILTVQADGTYAWTTPSAGGSGSGASSESSWRGYIGNNQAGAYSAENSRYMVHNVTTSGSPAPKFSAWDWTTALNADRNPKFTNAIFATVPYASTKSGWVIHLGSANGNNVGFQMKRGQSAPFKANWRIAIPWGNLEFSFAIGIAFPSATSTASNNFGVDNTILGGLTTVNAGIVAIAMDKEDTSLKVMSVYNGGASTKIDTGLSRANLINKFLDITAELVTNGTELEFTMIDIVANTKMIDKVKVPIQAPGNNLQLGRVYIGMQKWDSWPVFDRPQGMVLVSMMCHQPAFASI